MRRASGTIVGLLAAGVCVGAPAAPAAAATSPGIAYVTGSGSGLPRVWVAQRTGAHARRLGKGSEPLLSPNGLNVAAISVASQGPALFLYPTSGGAAKSYFDLASEQAIPLAWSPDSRYLAVELVGNSLPSIAGYGLAIVDTQTGTATEIEKGDISGASFAPGASDTLAYASASSTRLAAAINIYTVAANGTGRRKITHDGRSFNPVWGARGIAFDHERFRKNFFPLAQISLMRSNGSRRRQITHIAVSPLAEGLVPLAFSADGTRLAAEFEGQDTSIGYSVSVLTGRATQLKVGNQAVSAWGIARDGRSVLISVGGFMAPPSRAKIERIPFSGGHATRLIAHGNFPSWNR